MKITKNEKMNFIVIESDSNKYITTYKDDESIENYYASTIAYCPSDFDTSIYREITEDEHNIYLQKQEDFFNEMEKMRLYDNNR